MLSHLLPQFKLFDGVSVGLLEHLEDALIKREYGPDQLIFQRDEVPSGFYLILSGRVKAGIPIIITGITRRCGQSGVRMNWAHRRLWACLPHRTPGVQKIQVT